MVYIIRNASVFGPYDRDTLGQMVRDGKILKCDTLTMDPEKRTATMNVGDYLKDQNLSVEPSHYGSISKQIRQIGSDLLLPKGLFSKKFWSADNRLLPLAFVGLTPLALTLLPFHGFLLFYIISLYFSLLWSVFFFYFFNTSQVDRKFTWRIFLFTQLLIFVIWGLNLNHLNPFYAAVDGNSSLSTLAGFVLGVGLTEEFVKSIPLLIILRLTKRPLIPRTLVFYGLISGVAFGVYEGVEYQMSVNSHLGYNEAYFSNILRLTSLPFFHAVLTGILGFFLSFAKIYPRFRKSLYALAYAVPILLHGLYDFFASNNSPLLSFCVCILTVVLLTYYLRNCTAIQERIKNY